ncbi:MAG: polysaccharide biosynthesis tyrosine autokinase, partial [Actinobacteria bacterium]|nr:polysaccharide biosynthesis tyrosine autokinase [Actinomycetota bacterium]
SSQPRSLRSNPTTASPGDPWAAISRQATFPLNGAGEGSRAPHVVADDGLALLLRHKRTVALIALLTGIVAFTFSILQKPVYRASADLLLQTRRSQQIVEPDSPRTRDRSQIQTELQVLKSRSIRDQVAHRLGKSPGIAVQVAGETDVLQLSAESTNRKEAAIIANTYVDTYIASRRQQLIDDLLAAAEDVRKRATDIDEQLRALDGPISDLEAQIATVEGRLTGGDTAVVRQATADRNRLGQELAVKQRQAQTLQDQKNQYDQQLDQLQLTSNLTESGGAQAISRAEAPQEPVRPKPVRNAILGLILGAMLGLALAFVRDRADNTVRTELDLETATDGLRLLATIPTVPGWRRRGSTRVVSVTEPTSRAAESYRALRTSLEFLGRQYTTKVVQLTSPGPGEGKTATIANLAVALAQTGSRVAVVCCDLRRPRLHEFFGLSNDVGLTSVVTGQVPLDAALVQLPNLGRIAVLPSGPPPSNPSELLASRRTAELLEALADASDIVLIDSAPVLPVTDAVVLARMVDATILVSKARKTTTAQVRRAVERLRQVDAPFAGAVLNQFDATKGEYYYYGPAPAGLGGLATRVKNRITGENTRTSRQRTSVSHDETSNATPSNGQAAPEEPAEHRSG